MSHFLPQGYGNTKFVFQGVHETICYGPAEQPWKPNELRMNQLVFIGRGLDRQVRSRFERGALWSFYQCFAGSGGSGIPWRERNVLLMVSVCEFFLIGLYALVD